MGRNRWGLLVVVICTLAAAPLAHGANVTPLPFVGFGDIAVDSTAEHVFVSSGLGGSAVAVFDFDGNLVTTITGQQGASGLAVDESTGTLYVGLANVSQISMIDTTSLTETDRFPTTGMSSPRYLALVGGRLWFAYGCPGGGTGSVALDGTDPQPFYFFGGCVRFAVYPGNPDRFAITDQGGSTVYVYDVSTGTPTEVTHSFSPGDVGNIQQVAVSPSGEEVFIAAAAPYQLQRFSAADFTLTNVYPTGPYPVAAALTSDGAYLAGGTANGYSPDIYVYDASTGTEVRRWNFETDDVVSRGLAFSSDASRLFAVSVNSSATGLALHTFGSPTEVPAPTSVSLSVSASTINYGQSVKLTAHLAGVTSGTVSFSRIPSGSTKTPMSSVAVDASGNASVTYQPSKNTTFFAEYAGDDTHAASAAPVRVVKVRVITTIALRRFYGSSGKYKLYHASRRPLLIGKVAPNYAGQMLTFVAQRYSGGRWLTIPKATFSIESDGRAYAKLIAPRGSTYRVRTVFKNHTDNLGDSSPWAYLKITA